MGKLVTEYGKMLIANTQLYSTFSNNAKQHVTKKFDIDKNTKLIRKIYLETKSGWLRNYKLIVK